jgi:hypothetical protein
MTRTIYLDLDDVCNTLTPYLVWWFTNAIKPTDYSQLHNEDVVAAVNRVTPGWTKQSFWDQVSQKEWASVPESPELPWLLRTCQKVVGHSIYIATSPTKDPGCLAGKLEWIQQNLPNWMHRQYFITPRKHHLAKPGTLLIDDNEANCLAFRANGGRAVLYPRPWNSAGGQPIREYLLERLYQLNNLGVSLS